MTEPPQDEVYVTDPRLLEADEFADWIKILKADGGHVYDPNEPGREVDDQEGDTAVRPIPPEGKQ